MRLYMLLFCTFLQLGLSAQNLPTQVTKGRITDASTGKVIPGVIITNKNQQRSVSNTEGLFTISTWLEKDSLVFSHIGYQLLKLPIGLTNQPITVNLQPVPKELEEVMVSTGYQQIAKERATGSFSQVNRELLNEQVSTDILSRLEATGSSIRFEKRAISGSFSIRGLSSIIGPKDPLVILDNFPYEGDINNINPNDVENITILKDAAATSIWGSRAGNGVLVITTRKGKYNQPLRIDLNLNTTSIAKPDLYYLPAMSSSDYIDAEKFLFGNGFFNSFLTNVNRPGLTPVVELLYQKSNGTISATDADAQINAFRSLDVRDDFLKWVYRPAFKQQYSLNISGGSSRHAWAVSGGLDKNRSELDAQYQRVNLRLDQTFKIGNKTSLQTAIYFTDTKSLNGKKGYGSINGPRSTIYPYAQLADKDGNALPLSLLRKPYTDTAGGGRLMNWDYYPLKDEQYLNGSSLVQDILLNMALQHQFTKSFSGEIRYQYERQVSDMTTTYEQDSYFTRDLINRYSQINYATGQVSYRIPKGDIMDITYQRTSSEAVRAQLNYQQQWKQHQLVLLGGAEYRRADNGRIAYRNYGVDPITSITTGVDFVTLFPDFVSKSNRSIPRNVGGNGTFSRYISYYANAAYTYHKRYILSGSIRRDASNLFGVSTNNKWSPLYSTGISWLVSDEPFYKNKWLPKLKLRATYGMSGNADSRRSGVTTIRYQSNSPITGLLFASVGESPNPSLRWEKVATWNLGLDFSTRNNRISGSVEFYVKKGIDLFGNAPVDYTTGVGSTIIRNVANLDTRGWDAEIHTINTTGIVQWSSHLNLSINRDRVEKYYVADKQGSRFLLSDGNNAINALEGYPVYGAFFYKWAGLDPQNGNPRGLINGQPSSNYATLTGTSIQIQDLAYFGTALPRVFGSLRNTINWKQFSVSVNLLYKFNYYFKKPTISYNSLFVLGTGHADYARRWQQPGDEANTTVPSMIYPNVSTRDQFYTSAEIHAVKGDHIRLQYINLGYDLAPRQLQKLGLQQLQVYLNLQNLGILWRANQYGLDPDYSSNVIPPSRTISIGIRTRF